MHQYILDANHNPVPESNLRKWGAFMDTPARNVAVTMLPDGGRVSTVFLGIDHAFGPEAGPILFETMIFGGRLGQRGNEYQVRYRTWDEAVAGHEKAVALATAPACKRCGDPTSGPEYDVCSSCEEAQGERDGDGLD